MISRNIRTFLVGPEDITNYDEKMSRTTQIVCLFQIIEKQMEHFLLQVERENLGDEYLIR